MYVMFHDDWEIFGNGMGDPQVLMFDPARRIMDICDKYGARYTFFAEIGQQFNMKESPEKKWRDYSERWEEILKEAIVRGHDVQLHFHPQWIGATLERGNWSVNRSYWHSANVEPQVFEKWIRKGKKYLEDLLCPLANDYEVIAFRAGGWLCQPSGTIYNTLKKNGFLADVSVARGRYSDYGKLGKVDFNNTVSNIHPWEVDPDDFAKEKQGSGLWEFPVYTESTSLPLSVYLILGSLDPIYYYQMLKKRRTQGKGNVKGLSKVGKPVLTKSFYGSFDYIHYRHLHKFIRRAEVKGTKREYAKYVILLAHSKSFVRYDNFKKLLQCLKREERIFTTTRSFIREQVRSLEK